MMVPDCADPGGSEWQDSADNILIQVQSERQIDLLGNAWAAVSRIALLHLDDGFDYFSVGPLGPGFLPPRGE